ncbi:MAG: polysaccharide biosynthesis/export family protein [bacterium]
MKRDLLVLRSLLRLAAAIVFLLLPAAELAGESELPPVPLGSPGTDWQPDAGDALPEAETGVPAAPAPPDYVVGAGDELEIFVWRNDQLSRRVTVMPDGTISLPLIQKVSAAGFTAEQIRDRITELLSDDLERPRVNVIVSATRSCRVTVLGRVVKPGVYPLTGTTTVIEAISMAGGLTEWAKKRKITVITRRNGKEESVRINYNKIVSGEDLSQNLVLQRGDTIVVP